MIYRMTATGVLGTEFIYQAEGPDDLSDLEVAMELFKLHGTAIRSGERSEPLSPYFTVDRL